MNAVPNDKIDLVTIEKDKIMKVANELSTIALTGQNTNKEVVNVKRLQNLAGLMFSSLSKIMEYLHNPDKPNPPEVIKAYQNVYKTLLNISMLALKRIDPVKYQEELDKQKKM
jgi:hypothetical protein